MNSSTSDDAKAIRQCRECRTYVDVTGVPDGFQPLCPACQQPGTIVAPAAILESPLLTQQSTMALMALILGILSCISCMFPLGIVAATLGFVAHRQVSRNPQLTGKGLATAGICLGIVSLVGALLVIAAAIIPALQYTIR